MPIYEFKCKDCKANFEKQLSINKSGSPQRCPKCGSSNVVRVFSSFSIGKSRLDSDFSPPSASSCPSGVCGI